MLRPAAESNATSPPGDAQPVAATARHRTTSDVLTLNRIPLSYWYRFRLAVDHTPTRLIVTGDQPLVKSCARVQIEVKRERLLWSGPVFEGIDFELAHRKARLQMAG